MGIKKFLIEKGFVSDNDSKLQSKPKEDVSNESPAFFPVSSFATDLSSTSKKEEANDPSFVAPLQKTSSFQPDLDPTFVKFFEDELIKANLPGPDYFEFRQLLIKTQQKMAAKGVVAPEVVLQTVIMSFDAQDISPLKLIDSAKHYKDALQKKNDDFLKGASAEKNNQLQKRQSALQAHEDNIKKIQLQIQQLEQQQKELNESLNKEKTQMDVDKTLGKEGIEKIEKAERLISLAHTYIQSSIDTDIKKLQSI